MTNHDLSQPWAQEIRDRLDAVAEQVAEAAQGTEHPAPTPSSPDSPAPEAGGTSGADHPRYQPGGVSILLATKTQPVEKIRVALEHGFTLIGENRVQELVSKAEGLADLSHQAQLIGPLQRNKVNHTLPLVTCIQSLDNLPLATKINNRLGVLESTVECFVQVNTSREDTKSGVAPEAAAEFVGQLAEFERLKIRGLMTIGLPGSTAAEIRPSYAALRELRDDLLRQGILPARATELSMGMSNDFALAIAEGATMVRVGSSVFGSRPPVT